MQHCAIERWRLAHRALQSPVLSVHLQVARQLLVRGLEVGCGRHLVRAHLRGVVHDARVDARDGVVLRGRVVQQVLRSARLQDGRGRCAPLRVAKVAREVPVVVALVWHLHALAICGGARRGRVEVPDWAWWGASCWRGAGQGDRTERGRARVRGAHIGDGTQPRRMRRAPGAP